MPPLLREGRAGVGTFATPTRFFWLFFWLFCLLSSVYRLL